MYIKDIANKLKDVLPLYTSDFNDELTITSLTMAGNVATAITSINHNLATGNYITISGARSPVSITITYNDKIATATSAIKHKLIDPSAFSAEHKPILLSITSANNDYNGSFELLSVVSDYVFTFKLLTTPIATASGVLLETTFNGKNLDSEMFYNNYNGYKQITRINDTTFTYEALGTMQSPALGTIKAKTATRVETAMSVDRALDDYYAKTGDIKSTIYVVGGQANTFKNDIANSSGTTKFYKNADHRYILEQRFFLLVLAPLSSSVLGGSIADTCRNYRRHFIKAIANIDFSSGFTTQFYTPAIYLGDEMEADTGGRYGHRYDFACQVEITNEDVNNKNNGSALNSIINQNSNINFNVDV